MIWLAPDLTPEERAALEAIQNGWFVTDEMAKDADEHVRAEQLAKQSKAKPDAQRRSNRLIDLNQRKMFD
jgi:hypothetical protein